MITNNTKPDTLIYTIPNISNNNKLASKIANALSKKGITTQENTVDIILRKLNLHLRDELNKQEFQSVLQLILKLNSNELEPTTTIPEMSQHHHHHHPPKQEVTTDETAGLVEPDTKLCTSILIVDSKDRSTDKWTLPNPFSVSFGFPSRVSRNDRESFKGNIDREFSNVAEIELIEAIFPVKTFEGDNVSHYPYFILEIEELGNHILGTNQHLSSCFARIVCEQRNNGYMYYTKQNNDNMNKKIFSPRISLNKLTFILRNSDGQIINIQPFVDDQKKKKSFVSFTLAIKYYQRTLETVYIY